MLVTWRTVLELMWLGGWAYIEAASAVVVHVSVGSTGFA